jgi:hypothetical protein
MTQRVDKDSLPLDKPRRTPGHPTKSHIVKTKVDGKEKIIRFGEQGASTAGKPKAGESERMKTKRASFKARHARNIAKGKSSPAYWANKVKWADGGAVSLNALAAKYDDGGEVSIEDLEARLRTATPLERQTYEALRMEPGLDRAAFLPIAGSRSGGDLQMAMPGFIYDIGKALMTPGAAARGVPLSYEDVVNMAANTMGGGLAISSPVEGAVAGMAVKRKGGNWLDKSVDEEIAPLRDSPRLSGEIINDIAGRDIFSEYRRAYDESFSTPGLPMLGLHDWTRRKYPEIYNEALEPESRTLNRWLDTKLNEYIRNDMGTPEDPVRIQTDRLAAKKADALAAKDEQIATARADMQLADTPEARRRAESKVRRLQQERASIEAQNVLHAQPRQIGPQTAHLLANVREMEGFPAAGFGQSELAQRWENTADNVIQPRQARNFLATANAEGVPTTERYPWLLKVPPETTVYDLAAGNNMRDLGFDHLVDELRNAMDPTTDLPNNLRIDPKDLHKITMPQAVERVARINDWRTEQAIRAEREGMMANLQATPRIDVPEFALSFTEQPGGKWVDIPETVDEKGMTLCTSIGKAGGWCTQGEGLAKEYGSGGNRLAALVDAEGRPHAQAKISSSKIGDVEDFAELDEDDLLQRFPELNDDYYRYVDDVDGDIGFEGNFYEWLTEFRPETLEELNKPVLPKPDITELKPPGNSFDSDRAQEYAKRDPQYKGKVTESALKFLNSGDWGRVNQNDLGLFGIVDLNDTNSVMKYLEDLYDGSEYVREADMIFNAAVDNAPAETPRFMNRRQFIDFLEPFEPIPPENYARGGAVRKKGYARGGAVRAYDQAKIDELVSRINAPGFAAGGAVRSFNTEAVDALVNKVLEGNYG